MGNLRQWNAVPYDKRMKSGTRMFMEWCMSATQALCGVLEPLPAVQLSVEGVAGGVSLSWDEIPNAGVYLCFETDFVGELDVPFAVVRSKDTGTNGAIRSGSTDTNTRFYYVQAVSPLGVLGNLAGPVEGAAASAIDLTGLDDLLLPGSIELFREDFLTGVGGNLFEIGAYGFTVPGTITSTFIDGTFPYTGILRIGSTASGAECVITMQNVGGSANNNMGKIWNQPGAFYSDLSTILPKDSLTGWHLTIIFRAIHLTFGDVYVGFAESTTSFIAGLQSFGIRQLASDGFLTTFQKRTAVSGAPGTVSTLVWADDHSTKASIPDTNWHRLEIISSNGPQLALQHGSIFMRCYLDGRQMVENLFFESPYVLDTGTGSTGALTNPMGLLIDFIKQEAGVTLRQFDVDFVSLQFTRQQPIVPELPRWFESAPRP